MASWTLSGYEVEPIEFKLFAASWKAVVIGAARFNRANFPLLILTDGGGKQPQLTRETHRSHTTGKHDLSSGYELFVNGRCPHHLQQFLMPARDNHGYRRDFQRPPVVPLVFLEPFQSERQQTLSNPTAAVLVPDKKFVRCGGDSKPGDQGGRPNCEIGARRSATVAPEELFVGELKVGC